MALFEKISALGKYQDSQAIPDLIAYITSNHLWCSCRYAGHDKQHDCYIGTVGKNSRLRLHHFIFTFQPNDFRDYGIIPRIMERICGYKLNIGKRKAPVCEGASYDGSSMFSSLL